MVSGKFVLEFTSKIFNIIEPDPGTLGHLAQLISNRTLHIVNLFPRAGIASSNLPLNILKKQFFQIFSALHLPFCQRVSSILKSVLTVHSGTHLRILCLVLLFEANGYGFLIFRASWH